ncbi:2TM domain-containing protein [Flavobacterium aquicola]|uniref:2TM domain-containing protein n=1 Tax=Flavobacterium aquicola TaxID=1682742 RepID=A0A3E0ETY5_9FLAO|nr:2TM domain-containing protein [Flavobacterium aquicola]REH01131.1 2TM domain-containing protein [Flavobacterium aquicola]
MENNLENEIRYSRAKKRVEKIISFYWHLVVYFSIVPCVIFINLKFTPEFHWFWYSIVCSTVPLFIHALKVFVYNDNWEERKIQKILKKEK